MERVVRYFSLGLFKESKWFFSYPVCCAPKSASQVLRYNLDLQVFSSMCPEHME